MCSQNYSRNTGSRLPFHQGGRTLILSFPNVFVKDFAICLLLEMDCEQLRGEAMIFSKFADLMKSLIQQLQFFIKHDILESKSKKES